MPSSANNIKYFVCSQCHGNGNINKKLCPQCNGRGVEVRIGEVVYYWNRPMDTLYIYQSKVHRMIDAGINFFLFILVVSGILSLGSYIYLNFNSPETLIGVFSPSFITSSRDVFFLLCFWISVLSFMYLFYRLERNTEKGVKVKRNLSFLRREEIKADIENLGKNRKIEISSSFTNNAIKAVEKAYQLSQKNNNYGVNPLYLLISLLFFEKINNLFFRLGVDYEKLKFLISSNLPSLEKNANYEYFVKRVLTGAYMEAYKARKEKVDVEEILISLVKYDGLYPSKFKDGVINEILYNLEIDLKKIENVVDWIRIKEKLVKSWRRYRHKAIFRPKGIMNKAMTAVATPILDVYSQDLTMLAKYGFLFPCIGREKEMEDIFRILESGSRGIILCGNPGVGKMSIIEGIAQMMVSDDVPETLRDKRLVSLSIAKLVSGTNPQQAMERLMFAINEALRSRNIILVIDSIEEMIGISAGNKSSLDLAEVLVSAMAKSPLTVIATATPGDYVHYIEQSSLISVFQKVKIEEPGDDEVIRILEANTPQIEGKDNVYFSYGAIEKLLVFTKRFIHDRFLPEKAIQILDEVGLFVKQKRKNPSVVLAEDVAELISQKVEVPISKVTEKESEKLLKLEERLHQRVINQDPAVKAVADALRRARVEFRDIKRPIANLLFLGPTGVGKTELAKAVAEVYFGSEKELIRVDMSEYQTKESIDRLIGAPNDYEVMGILTEAVRKNPFALLLLDEIEKAHKDILNIFLQVMDDGQLTDNRGRVIDFTNLIIIATSNAGTGFIQEEIKKGADLSEIKEGLMNRELKIYFRPEFLNRFDGIIVFKPLTVKDIHEIAELMLKSSAKRMDEKGIKLKITEEGIDWIAKLGYDPIFGARPLRRAIQENIDSILAEYLISGKLKRGSYVVIGKNGKTEIK